LVSAARVGLTSGVMISFEHLGLASANPDALRSWYVSVLGAEDVYADGKTPPAFFIRFPGGLLIEIYASNSRLEETANNSLAGWRHLALRVERIEPVRDVLAARGVDFQQQIKPAGGGGRVLFFKDPEGNLWHLVERSADSPLR
jgi:glyoxylase I family protein